ncbi:hypothetical protein PPGU19_090690 (plasmid) [Paraburkholderia sp. PGU19]|uniref:dicarboxylate/amino acid:cation symporter n=1 Tax=Paraburkholderia sp. PGU19 TaxID=2735434 RepID=UPI0015DB3817|nr:hypothetical protein PPGU19_090690 [Paraburkholderia sp. PGU19]
MKTQVKLTRWIMFSMVLGVAIGYVCHQMAPDGNAAKAIAADLGIITEIFLRLIKMIIAPLVFATLVSGISSMESGKAIGRIGVRAVGWFILASLISLSIGLLFVNLAHPGMSMNLPLPGADASTNLKTSALNAKDFLTHMFPGALPRQWPPTRSCRSSCFRYFSVSGLAGSRELPRGKH